MLQLLLARGADPNSEFDEETEWSLILERLRDENDEDCEFVRINSLNSSNYCYGTEQILNDGARSLTEEGQKQR